MLKRGLPLELRKEVIRALKEYEGAIMKAGEVTQVDYKTNGNYVNIIFDIGNIIKELQDADRN